MKTEFKILLLLSLIICFVSETNAQLTRKKFTSDIHVGINLSEMDVNGGNNDANKLKPGAVIGVNFNYKIWHNIQVQTGFFVSKKGLKQESHNVVETGLLDKHILDTINVTVANYIQVPLCLGYEVYLTKNFAVNLNVGVYGAYGFKGNYENKYSKSVKDYDGNITIEPLVVEEGETFDINKYSRWDYGLIGSVGFIYDIFSLNLNYEHGLNNVSAVDWINLKNRNISILLGIRF